MSDLYRIKKLEWKDVTVECQILEAWHLESPIGLLWVYRQKASAPTWGGEWCDSPFDEPCDSIDDGKAKATAFYVDRLKAALDPA